MKKEWGIALVVVRILLLGAGFYPLSHEVKFEEKGAREETWFREEKKYREVIQVKEESYTEKIEKKLLIVDNVLYRNNGSLTKTEKAILSNLKRGNLLHLNVGASSEIVVKLFSINQGCTNGFYGSPNQWPYIFEWWSNPEDKCFLYQGDSFEKFITLPIDDDFKFEVVSIDPFWRLTPAKFSIQLEKVHYETKSETVTKTRQVEVKVQESYTTKIPYTTQIP